jgi:hypothetical protein
MAARILYFSLSISQLTLDQAWDLFVLLASEIALVYFMREVWRRCDF